MAVVLAGSPTFAAPLQPARTATSVADLRAEIAAVETSAATAATRALEAASSAERARGKADAAAARAAALEAQTADAETELLRRREQFGTVAAGLYRSASDAPILARLLTTSDPDALLGRLSVLERVTEASARSAFAARSAARLAATLREQASVAAEEHEHLAAEAEAAAAAAQGEADAERAAVASAQSALDAMYARLAAMRGTTPARERQVYLAERAQADATAPGGATGGGASAGGGAAVPSVPAPHPPAPNAPPAPKPPAPDPPAPNPPAPNPPAPGTGPVMTPGQAQAHARGAISRYGWGDDQFGCLVALWNRESGWRVEALNRSSGAYGIPQALPGTKMASAGPDWRTNGATQISWGLAYISARYGSPCGAWDHSQRTGWY
jgi:hypothetical protein